LTHLAHKLSSYLSKRRVNSAVADYKKKNISNNNNNNNNNNNSGATDGA